MNPQKGFAPIIIITIIVAVLGLGGTWFLYAKNQSLIAEKSDLESKLTNRNADIEKLKNEKARSEQELAMLKASDLAKEVELLRLKLKNTEVDLAAIKGKIAPLDATMTKIRLYADVVAAFNQNLAPPPPTPPHSNLKNIDVKVSALNDSEVTEQWRRAKLIFDTGGDGGAALIQTFLLVISKTIGLLP